MKIKLILSLLIMFFWGVSVWGQQDPLFTQYMTNPITINPAIAGMRKVSNLSLMTRLQWAGIEGAPKTSSLSYQLFLDGSKVGLGVNLIHDRIGPVVQTGIYFDYAYHLIIDDENKHRLSLGLMGGFNYYTFDLLSLSVNGGNAYNPVDGLNRKFLPNFGVGFFYYTPTFFFGASLPKILRNSLSSEENTLTIENKEERHFYAMTGVIIDVSQKIKFKPSIIFRVVNGVPVSLDLNGTVMFLDKLWLGAMYRFNNSYGVIARFKVNDRMHLGYSYDMINNRLRAYNNGTHEVFISYDFGADEKLKDVLRFF